MSEITSVPKAVSLPFKCYLRVVGNGNLPIWILKCSMPTILSSQIK